MLIRILLFSVVVILLQACCTKKACLGEEPPVILFKFSDPKTLAGERVVIKTFLNNRQVDSLVISDDFDRTYSLVPFSFHGDEEGKLKTYQISINGKISIIDQIDCEFLQEEIKCNECFPFRVEKEFIEVNQNFSFRHEGQTFFEGSVLTLD